MNKLNKYWNLSWGFIFDYLDREAHKLAIKKIKECETIHADINYFWKVTEEELEKTRITRINVCESWTKIIIEANCNNLIIAKFIFIKKK